MLNKFEELILWMGILKNKAQIFIIQSGKNGFTLGVGKIDIKTPEKIKGLFKRCISCN